MSVALPVPFNSLGAVNCPTATRCVAVGSTVGVDGAPNGAGIVTSSTGGASWTVAVVPPTVGFLSDVACTDGRRCVAVGQTGQAGSGLGAIVATTNGGTTWIPEAVPAGAGDVTAVSCLATGRCVALATGAFGAIALVSSSPGATWTQAGVLPPGMSGATAISCTDDQHCWATARTMPTSTASPAPSPTRPTGASSGLPLRCPPRDRVPERRFLPGDDQLTSGAAGASGVAGVDCVVVGTTSSTLDAVRSGRGVILTSANGGGSWTSESVSALRRRADRRLVHRTGLVCRGRRLGGRACRRPESRS